MTFLKLQLAALFTSTAFLSACGNQETPFERSIDTSVDINLTRTEKLYTSKVFRRNDDVNVTIEPTEKPRRAENFTFTCSDRASLQAAQTSAAIEVKILDALVQNNLKSLSPDILDKPDQLQGAFENVNKRDYARGKAHAFKEVERACAMTMTPTGIVLK